MLLGFTNGRNFDITGAINGDDAHSTVAHSHVLTEFAQYVCDGLLGDGLYDSQVSNLRLQIVEKLGEKALIEVNAHERECALRYERIEERLAEGSAKFKHLEHLIYGLYALIAAAALPQFFMG